MKNYLIRSLFAAAVLGGVVSSVHATEAGAVDFGAFTAAPGREFVEINLKPGLLKFAARIVAQDEPAAADLLRNVRHVRVKVVGLDDSNHDATVSRIEEIRRVLETQGWEKIVTVRADQKHNQDDVAIFLKSTSEEAIDGIVVTVIGHDGEAVLVNVVGKIKPEQIGELARHLNITPLEKLHLNAPAPAETAA